MGKNKTFASQQNCVPTRGKTFYCDFGSPFHWLYPSVCPSTFVHLCTDRWDISSSALSAKNSFLFLIGKKEKNLEKGGFWMKYITLLNDMKKIYKMPLSLFTERKLSN